MAFFLIEEYSPLTAECFFCGVVKGNTLHSHVDRICSHDESQ